MRLLLALFLLLAACQKSRPLPDLPQVELKDSQAAVRDAIKAALRSAQSNPNDAAVVARLGMVLHAHSQMAAAATAYQRAVGLDPNQPDYLYYLGVALASDGNYAKAIEPLRKSIAIKPSVPVRLFLADALYSAGQSADARKEYEALIAADPSLAAAHYGLGRCQEGEEAAMSLRRAVELFQRYGAARFALAAVYRQLGNRPEATAVLADYDRDKLLTPPIDDPAMAAVQALDVSSTGLLRNAQSLERQGQLAKAAELQERALAADPKLTQAWVNLISLYARTGRPEKAEAAYRKAIALEPKNSEAYYNYGVLCTERERFEDAQRAFESAIAADPANAEALDNLGAIVERSGAWDRAASLYRRAIASKPGLRLAHFHLGRIRANQKRYIEAIAEFEKAIIEPADDLTPGYRYALGAAHARAGARKKAIEVLTRADDEARRLGQSDLAAAISRDLEALQKAK